MPPPPPVPLPVSAAPSKALAVPMPQVPASPEPLVRRPAAVVTAGAVPGGLSGTLLSRALQAQFLMGNAAVAAWLMGVPPGGLMPGGAGPPGLAGSGPAGPTTPVAVPDGLTGQAPLPAGPAAPGGLPVPTGPVVPGTRLVGTPAPGIPPQAPTGTGLPPVAAAAPAAGTLAPGSTALAQLDLAGALAGPPTPTTTGPAAGAAAPATIPTVAAAAPATAAPDTQVARPHADKDPKFTALKQDIHAKKQHVAASHPPPRTEAGSAQGAARPPADDKVAQGKVANADKMNDAKPKDFDKAAFIKAVQQAIAAQAPKNLDEADKFADSDKPQQVKKDVQGRVDQGKQDSAQDIATTTAAPPDTSKAVTRQVVPMSPDRPPGTPAIPNPANAVPDKLPPSATDLSAGPRQVDAQMADAQVTEPQLAHANEPAFTTAVQAKHGAEQDSAQATPAMRGHEAATLKAATADAQHQGTAGMHHLATARVVAGQKVTSGKQGAKGSDEAKRAQVTATLQKVFDATKRDVETLLSGLDHMVDDQFSREEKQARDAFTREHKWNMAEYKAKRYSGPLGPLRWGKDKLLGLPKEADQIFTTARNHYITRMQTVISHVADTIGTQLDAAKARIAKGRADLQDTVRKLPADLRAIGAQAAEDFAGKFDELNQQVDEKSNDLVQTLASKYNEALKSVDDEMAKEKEKNKGLVNKAIDAVKGVIKTILELKNLLLGVLRKAASAVMLILKDPIGFLKNLVGAVGAGLKQFLRNIVQHLEQGLVSWLLGVSAQAGLTLPKSFDVKSILMLIAGLLGLTWQFIRSRIVRKIPEKVVAAVETGVTLIMKIRKEGIAGLWDEIKAQIGDLKHTLISKVTEFLLPTIIVAGIMWVLSLLNPASAFVRACKLIIDIIQFIVERGRQIIDFVNAVLDAVIAIAKGGTGGVPGLIENALARSIPVLIGFLASLLGIGGIADRVKKIFQALSKPVAKAVDWVVDKIVGLAKKLWAKLERLAKNAKEKLRKAKERIKAGLRRARQAAKRKLGAIRDRLRDRLGRRRSPDSVAKPHETEADRALRLQKAVAEVNGLMRGPRLSLVLRVRLALIRRKYQLTTLSAMRTGRAFTWDVLAAINPQAEFELFSIRDDALALRNAIADRLDSLPPDATIADVKRLCNQQLVADYRGYSLEWKQMPDSWVLFLLRPGHDWARSAVGQFRPSIDWGTGTKLKGQTLFRASNGKEYVLDHIDQKVPRHVARTLNEHDYSTRRTQGPVARGKSADIYLHVIGESRASRYISATKLDLNHDALTTASGTVFDAGFGWIRIDLAKIPASRIYDLTSKRAHTEWSLSGRDPRGVEDPVRTQEIFIRNAIPLDAIIEYHPPA
jgi:hypothetical protein